MHPCNIFYINNALMPGDGAFSADGVADLADLPYLYARWTNPTVRQLEQRLASAPVKAALALSNLAGPEMRLPMVPVSPANRERLPPHGWWLHGVFG